MALTRKNALFAGSDGGGEHWAILASLIETYKLNAVEPQAYLADVLAKLDAPTELLAAELEAVQMLVVPAHRGLDDAMQALEVGWGQAIGKQ